MESDDETASAGKIERESEQGVETARPDASRELTRGATAYLACLAFAVTFLITAATRGNSGTAVIRGAIVALATFMLAPLLLRTVMSTVLDAMARDQAKPEPTEDAE